MASRMPWYTSFIKIRAHAITLFAIDIFYYVKVPYVNTPMKNKAKIRERTPEKGGCQIKQSLSGIYYEKVI